MPPPLQPRPGQDWHGEQLTLGMAAAYRILPRVKIAWRDVTVGAVAAAALFEAGKSKQPDAA